MMGILSGYFFKILLASDVRKFNEFDLYSKEEKFVLTDGIKKYYEDLIKDYLSLEKYKF